MSTTTSRVQPYFKDYASSHKTPGNQSTHLVGIPLIIIAVLGLMGRLEILGGMTGSEYFRLDGGVVVWLLSTFWYLRLEWRLGLPFALVTLGFYFLGRAIPAPALIGFFVVGWVVQYVGHYVFEHKSPAFYKSIQHLLVGPLWVFAKTVGYFNPR